MIVPIFSVAFVVHSTSLTGAQISEWAGVENESRWDVGDPIDPLDPGGRLRSHTTWSYRPEAVEESEDAEPWMVHLRPVLEGVVGRPLPDTDRKLFVGVRNGHQSGWFYLEPDDLALLAKAECALVVDSYDFTPEESRVSRARHWVLEKTGVYRRRRARSRRARDRAREKRIAARNAS